MANKNMREEYPLQWPKGWARTQIRRESQFSVTEAKALDEMLAEITKFSGDKTPILTSNVQGVRSAPDDPAVSVFFKKKGRTLCVGCDSYKKVRDNIRGVGLTIKAMRDVERYGCTAMAEQMFNAYEVPALTGGTWRDTLGLPREATLAHAEVVYKQLAKAHHPDTGGDTEKMATINAAMDEARRTLS